MEKISVLMCTYNEPIEWVSLTLNSVLNQTLKADEIVIIVDNPNNNEMIDFLKAEQAKNDTIKVYINEQNMGLVKSLNRGLTFCSGDYIARIDADDIALENRFEEQMKFIKEKNVDLVGAGFYVFYDDEILKTNIGVENAKYCEKIMNYNSIIAHPTWFMKKEVPEKLNGYRDIDSCEDLDYLQRAVLMGFKVANVREPLLKYRDNPNSISHVKKTKQHLLKTLLCECYKNKKIISENEIQQYLNSEQYKKDFKRKETYDSIKDKKLGKAKELVQEAQNGVLDIEFMIRLRNFKVNYWKNK
ncbi:MAG: glycosyltransferase [Pseudobutyrivibrio sp.]|uniref:glycosyltransferase n=1 Tax=Pseudobutyrivibrio sp. TaxID=2014367 RepID=UPI0025D98C37|nr:glycosyltransferase [Pseudobutyrivibrio sp.]MBQ8490525.1 glycosyltransferase [Pseudobutyrivibrio sp.]